MILQRYAILLARLSSLSNAVTPPTASTSKIVPPNLQHYLVHPLHALPDEAEPLAHTVMLEAINTMPLAPHDDSSGSSGASYDSVRRRLQVEKNRVQGLRSVLERVEAEYDWETRVGVDEDEGDEEPSAGEGTKEVPVEVKDGEGEDGDEEDDLFGDVAVDEDVSMDSTSKALTADRGFIDVGRRKPDWSVEQYIDFMDDGRMVLGASRMD